MEMIVSSAGITSIADISNDFSLSNKFADHNSVSVALQMGIVKHQLLVRAELIDCGSAAFALEKFYDLAVGSGHDWSSRGSEDIDCVVDTSFGARIRKRVLQLVNSHSNNWNNKLQRADKTSGEGWIFGNLVTIDRERPCDCWTTWSRGRWWLFW